MFFVRKSLKCASRNVNFGITRLFVKPTHVAYSNGNTKTKSNSGLGETVEINVEPETPEEKQPKENVIEETSLEQQDDAAKRTLFLEKINDESIRIVESLAELSEKRADEIVKTLAQQAKPEKVQVLDNALQSFFADFVGGKDKFVKPGDSVAVDNAMTEGYSKYPFLKRSDRKQAYTPQELYLRRAHHGKTSAALGSVISDDVYYPHKDLSHPQDYKEITIEKLLAAGAHLGQSVSLWRPSTQPYIYGEYRGIHIIDLEQTIVHLKRAAKIVEGVAEKGGIIVFLGTREGQARSVESAAERTNGYCVSERWIPGTITNCTEISKRWARKEIDLADMATGKHLTELEKSSLVKPDLIVVLNPVENRNAIREATQSRIPTIGIIDTDSEPSLVTYPIPANDDSIRTTNLICGILAKAGQTGRERRLRKVADYKTSIGEIQPAA